MCSASRAAATRLKRSVILSAVVHRRVGRLVHLVVCSATKALPFVFAALFRSRRTGEAAAAASAAVPAAGDAVKDGIDSESGEWSTDQSCIVCFGDYCAGDLLCRLPCRHVYHAKVSIYTTGALQDPW